MFVCLGNGWVGYLSYFHMLVCETHVFPCISMYMCTLLKQVSLFSASPQLLEKDLETIADYSGNDPIIKQFIIYASRAKCIRECKAKELRATLRYPDPDILNRFKRRETYSFLHFSYYQVRTCR